MGATGPDPGRSAALKGPSRPADIRDVAIVIKADCPECGVVRLGPRDVTVRACLDDGSGAYCFQCPTCGSAVHHDANSGVCDLLVSAGVQRVEWCWPRELGERHEGPTFTPDDVLDFHLLLDRDDEEWSRQLAGSTPDVNSTPT
jgi:hypothetical protein